jgi:hypothetical protein
MRAGVVLRPQGRLFGAFGASPTSKLVQAGFGINCCPEGCAETSSVELRAGQAGMLALGSDLHGNGAVYFPVSALLRAPLDG